MSPETKRSTPSGPALDTQPDALGDEQLDRVDGGVRPATPPAPTPVPIPYPNLP